MAVKDKRELRRIMIASKNIKSEIPRSMYNLTMLDRLTYNTTIELVKTLAIRIDARREAEVGPPRAPAPKRLTLPAVHPSHLRLHPIRRGDRRASQMYQDCVPYDLCPVSHRNDSAAYPPQNPRLPVHAPVRCQ